MRAGFHRETESHKKWANTNYRSASQMWNSVIHKAQVGRKSRPAGGDKPLPY